MTKIITLFILGILDCVAFIISVATLILLQFHPPISGSLRPSIWMCVVIILTIITAFFISKAMDKPDNGGKQG